MRLTMGRAVGIAGLLSLVGSAAKVEAAGAFIWPVTGRVTATTRYPGGGYHSGSADIGAPSWRSIGSGRFGRAYARWEGGGCGYYVSMTHASGYTSLYCHMVRWPAVGGGAYIGTNRTIGYVGSTGNSTGPHCHYAIRRWGTRLAIPGNYIGKYVTRGYIAGWFAGL